MTTIIANLSPTAKIYRCSYNNEVDAFKQISLPELHELIAQSKPEPRLIDLDHRREYFEMNQHDPRVASFYEQHERFFSDDEVHAAFHLTTPDEEYDVYVIA